MTGHDHEKIVFKRLSEVDPGVIIELMNDPVVRRHLPLARGHFGPAECETFVAVKERMWEESGYGPWAFVINDEFVGWGGLQPEGDDADVGLVLHPDHWGTGRVLYERIIGYAFAGLGLSSVTALLPPSRTHVAGILRLGFRRDGEIFLEGERFIRYRLTAPSATGRNNRE
jgi:RimJ/RimL family protein N-acetyltransferase